MGSSNSHSLIGQKRLNQCQTVGREGEEKGMVEIQTYGKGVKERERESGRGEDEWIIA